LLFGGAFILHALIRAPSGSSELNGIQRALGSRLRQISKCVVVFLNRIFVASSEARNFSGDRMEAIMLRIHGGRALHNVLALPPGLCLIEAVPLRVAV